MNPKAKVATMDLSTAKRVLLEAREAEEAARVATLETFIGRCFKYRNSYGREENWWLYARVTSVAPYVGCRGVRFERTSSGHIEIDENSQIGASADCNNGWQEIPLSEYRRAAASIGGIVDALLRDQSPPSRRKRSRA